MIQTYYHFTLKENVFSIMREGLKPGDDGFVYLCSSIEHCNKFIHIYRHKFTANSVDIAFIPIELDPADVKESFDHNEEFLGCKAYTYDKTIPPEKIPFLDKIPLYSVTFSG